MTTPKLNKKRLIFCLVISSVLSTYFYVDQHYLHHNLEVHGIKTIAYIKVAAKDITFNQKLKHTFNPVDKFFFLTTNGDTINGLRKSHQEFKELKNLQSYLPLDSIIYNKKDPASYLFVSEYGYSPVISGIVPGLGFIVFTIWFYMLFHVLSIARRKYLKK